MVWNPVIDGEIIKMSVEQYLKSWVKLPYPYSVQVLFTVRSEDGQPNQKGKVEITEDLNLLSEVCIIVYAMICML